MATYWCPHFLLSPQAFAAAGEMDDRTPARQWHEGIFEHKVYSPAQPLFMLRNTRPAQPHVF